MANRRAFIIVDTEAVHRKVEPIFKVAVRNPVRIKVDVEFEGERRLQKRGIFVRSNGKLGVSVGVDRKGVHLPGSLDVDIINRKETEDSYQKIMLMTMSGKAARIWSIQTEPVLSSLRHYQYQRHGYYSGQSAVVSELNFEEKTVGVSLWMKPTYSDDGLISVDVYPVLTGRVKGQKRSYRVNEVETTVVVQNNKRVHIGGHHKKINHFLSQLFAAYGKESGKDLLDIYLTAYAEKMHRKK